LSMPQYFAVDRPQPDDAPTARENQCFPSASGLRYERRIVTKHARARLP